MNRTKKFYLSHPLFGASVADAKYFRSFFSKNMIPQRYKCSFCGRMFHNFMPHGYVSEVAEEHDVSMGPRFSDCPYCHSVDKYRWLWYVIEKYTDMLIRNEDRLLHFAPEGPIKNRIKDTFRGEYLTGDLEPGRADYVVDMTDICFEDNSFDWIIACNVLEHICEEKKAIEELKRVIKPTGTIILSFPVAFDLQKTFEDSSIRSKEERIKNFGQEDHVRLYGMDYAERLASYGFHVNTYLPKDVMSEKEIRQNGFLKVSPVIFLQK